MAKKIFTAFLAVAVALLVAALLFPIFAQTKDGPRDPELSRMKMLALGVLMYADDHDDRLPAERPWLQQVNDVYVKNLEACRCARIPNASKSNAFGHAFRASMAGQLLGKVPHPESNIMLFDSMDLRMGAIGELEDMPNPPRKGEGSIVAYADGHARFLRLP